jgi:hypothetical protein
MNAKHTPGEWVVLKIEDGYAIKERELLDNGYSDRIAVLYEYPAEAAANAKLMAASKDMLEALQIFFELDNEPKIHGAMPVFLRTFRDKAKAAIQKATA